MYQIVVELLIKTIFTCKWILSSNSNSANTKVALLFTSRRSASATSSLAIIEPESRAFWTYIKLYLSINIKLIKNKWKSI